MEEANTRYMGYELITRGGRGIVSASARLEAHRICADCSNGHDGCTRSGILAKEQCLEVMDRMMASGWEPPKSYGGLIEQESCAARVHC